MRERDLFLAALDIEDRAARHAHLKVECAGDAELLARVESLLASHEGQSQFLNTPVVEQIADVAESVATATIAYENGSTHDDDPDATTLYSNGTAPMTKSKDDAEFETALGYLEPSSKPDSLGRLGHYEVLEVIGRGAFGTVLRAFDEKLHRIVAIKVMSPEMAATSPARKRFLREAQASAAIRHEHVVSVYAVEEKPLPYLVMEFIPGETLQHRLDARGPLDVPTVLHLGRQIAEGLAAAHAQELIHRDIKPGNILLETSVHDRVKITDFGLARAADDASLTQSGTIAGTPMYMAPEQALGNKLDQRADLFSFGSVLYQMVSGRPPFRASTTLTVLKRLAEDTPRPIREIIPETPQWLCDIITKLHAKNPGQRYQSAREIADVLANCEAQLKTHSGLKDFSLIPQAKTQPATWWKWVAVMVLMAPLLALGLYALNRPAAQPKVAEKGAIKPPTKPSDNYGLTFDGSAYVATPVMVPQEGPFTIEAWATPSRWEGSTLFSVICNAQNAGVSLELRRFETLDWGFSVQDQRGYQKALSTKPPETGRPVHLAGVFDGTRARLFVDGKLMETDPALNLPLKPSSLPLMIGANPAPGNQLPTYFFHGLIDEVRISNVARYTNDFSTANRFDKDEHTLALYHFDEGEGTVLKDSSGNGHHGKIVGAKWVKADGSPIPPAKSEPLPPTFKNSIGMEFVIVPKGKSWLGGGNDKLGDKEVEIPADFYLGQYEVTQEEWTQVMGENPSHFSRTGEGKDVVKDIPDADLKRFPVESVSWNDCQLFVAKLNQLENETGWTYRLPTATEWEYACRGGPMTDKTHSAFDFYFAKPTNNPLREQSSFGKNMGLNRAGKVGSHEANGLGIFDMHRNVWEWCDDRKESADGNVQRVQMGGGWNHIRWRSAAANIESELPSHRSNAIGLRLARVPSVAPSPEAKSPKQ